MTDSDDFMDPALLAEAAAGELLAALAGLADLRRVLRGEAALPENVALFSPRPTTSRARARKARLTPSPELRKGNGNGGQGVRGSWPRKVE